MSDYVLLYHGGSSPQTEEAGRRAMEAWTAWFERIGSAVKDPGNPFGEDARAVGPDGAVSQASGGQVVGGYSILTADSADAAVTLAKDCPALDSGSTITVHEITPIM